VQHGGCQADASQLGNAKVANDRGICQQEQWFGDQGTKRGDCEAEDFPGVACGRFCGGRGGLTWHAASLSGWPDIARAVAPSLPTLARAAMRPTHNDPIT
jgi:hypothetical protein